MNKQRFIVGDKIKIIDCQRNHHNMPIADMGKYIGCIGIITSNTDASGKVGNDWYDVGIIDEAELLRFNNIWDYPESNRFTWYSDWLELYKEVVVVDFITDVEMEL